MIVFHILALTCQFQLSEPQNFKNCVIYELICNANIEEVLMVINRLSGTLFAQNVTRVTKVQKIRYLLKKNHSERVKTPSE